MNDEARLAELKKEKERIDKQISGLRRKQKVRDAVSFIIEPVQSGRVTAERYSFAGEISVEKIRKVIISILEEENE